MSFRVIGQNATVTVALGGPQNGTAPAYSSAASIIALAKSIKIDQSTDTVEMPALGDTRKVVQVTRGGDVVTFDLFVGSAGLQFETARGQYVKVVIKSNSSLTAGTTYEGVCTAYSAEFPDGAQTESVTVTCGANGTTLT